MRRGNPVAVLNRIKLFEKNEKHAQDTAWMKKNQADRDMRMMKCTHLWIYSTALKQG